MRQTRASKDKIFGVVLVLLMGIGGVSAVEIPCADQIIPGPGPTFDNPGYAQQTSTVCFEGFATMYSGLTRTPLWSAEYLTPDRVRAAEAMERKDAFHEESVLPEAWRAHLTDYVRSGFDRGHLAPSGDMPTPSAQHGSFSLANIIPQSPKLNRGPWAALEQNVRAYARTAPVYVITGVRFEGATIGFLKGRVGVPPKIYKLVYAPAAQAASVFVADNQDGALVRAQAVAEFENEAGIRFRLGDVAPLDLELPATPFVR